MNAADEIVARSGEGLKSGPIAFATILVLCVVCYFLFKSMSKHLKKVREEFPSDEPPAAAPAPAAPTAAQAVEPPAAQTTSSDAAADGPAPSA